MKPMSVIGTTIRIRSLEVNDPIRLGLRLYKNRDTSDLASHPDGLSPSTRLACNTCPMSYQEHETDVPFIAP
jgi:hypothetical protein